MTRKLLHILFFLPAIVVAQVRPSGQQNDVTTPLHLLQPAYEIPYKVPVAGEIRDVIDRIYNYLELVTPASLDDGNGVELTNPEKVTARTKFKQGDFRLTSYEWGVAYAGMLLASQVTGDKKYADYTFRRLKFLSEIRPYFLKLEQQSPDARHAMFSVIHPRALDDCGSVCAAMIKAEQAGIGSDLKPMINNFIDYISNKQERFDDATLCRSRPMLKSLWLDDLFMSVPALARMGSLTGKTEYYDDAIRQVLQFSNRMFNDGKGLFMHGWIAEMEEHPQFHWARANGWALMAMTELLDVLPAEYPGRDKVLDLLKRHICGLAGHQSQFGFWHQLIDKNDSYLETSATAIYTYCMARAINRGYIDARVYGPVVCLAWNAVTTKVNEKGQVEGTCVGTGMGFDPAFYYYRPVNVFAAHGYGPVLLAGAEMIEMLKTQFPRMNDSAILFYKKEVKTNSAIFEVK